MRARGRAVLAPVVAWAMVQKQHLESLSQDGPAPWEIGLCWSSRIAIAAVGAIVIWKSVISA